MISKLDYRCRAIGCSQGNHCRRFLTGPDAKNCAVPFAAFDTRRDTVQCDGYLPRVMVPVVGNAELCGGTSATNAVLNGKT